MQCQGVTQSNKRCTRNVKKGQYCYQHKGQATEKPVRPLLGLPDSIEVTRKVETRIRRPPSKDDKEGWIYVYTLNSDHNVGELYYKIGRTEQGNVETRISQWKGAHLRKAFKVKYNRKAESLIHLLLDEHRVYRYPYEHGKENAIRYHTIRKVDGSVVQDNQTHDLPWQPPAKGKQIEWFNCRYRLCKQVITAVQQYLAEE